MSEWQGFDKRKICPKCGDYQTRVTSKQHLSFSSPPVLFSLVKYIGVASVPMIALLLLYLRPLNVYLLGLCFMGFVGLVIFFAYRSILYRGKRETIDKPSREKNWIGYSLYCRNCGYAWEMTVDEWKTAERKERENFINYPSYFPASKSSLNESFEKIEWKPPDPNKGIFIVIGFVGLSLIVSLLLYGVFWAKTHPQNPYTIVVNGIAAIFALFVYTGLIVVFKPKTNKVVLSILILVILIVLGLAVLRYLLV
jgi:hypothetical protein